MQRTIKNFEFKFEFQTDVAAQEKDLLLSECVVPTEGRQTMEISKEECSWRVGLSTVRSSVRAEAFVAQKSEFVLYS